MLVALGGTPALQAAGASPRKVGLEFRSGADMLPRVFPACTSPPSELVPSLVPQLVAQKHRTAGTARQGEFY